MNKLTHTLFIFLEGNLPKPGNPYCGPTNNQWPTTNQLTTEELKYSRHSAWQHQRPTNNMFKVWQNLSPFGGRPIGSAVEVLLTKVVNLRSSVLLIVFFLAATDTTRPNSIRLSYSQQAALRVWCSQRWCWEYPYSQRTLRALNSQCCLLRVWYSQHHLLTQPANMQAWRIDNAACLKIANK